jgi:hypothetical protein
MVRRRSQFKPWDGRLSELRGAHWFSIDILEGNLWICESCYLNRIALTLFTNIFSVSRKT